VDSLRLDASFVDYLLVVVYFAVVMLIGLAARRRVSDSLDFFLSGRSLPAWVTGLRAKPRVERRAKPRVERRAKPRVERRAKPRVDRRAKPRVRRPGR